MQLMVPSEKKCLVFVDRAYGSLNHFYFVYNGSFCSPLNPGAVGKHAYNTLLLAPLLKTVTKCLAVIILFPFLLV